MMSENIFAKIKLFLKERLKQFTGLYLGPNRVMKKPNINNQNKNKIKIYTGRKQFLIYSTFVGLYGNL